MPQKVSLILCAAALILLWGCASPIRVEENSAIERRSYGVADYSAGFLSDSTRNLLGNFLLNRLYEEDPAQVLSRLESLYKQEQRPEFISALADTALQAGYKFRDDSDLSSRYFLASAVYSFFYLMKMDDVRQPYSEQRIRLIRICNLAVTELFFYLKSRGLERRSGFEIPMPGSSELQVRFKQPVYDLPLDEKHIAHFTPCANYKTVGLTHNTRIFGLGVPMVAELKDDVKDVGGQLIPGLPVAVTLAANIEWDPKANKITAELHYIYSRVKSEVKFGERTLPLAADFSTPLARAVGRPQEMNFIERTVKVSEAERITGLYHLEPYDDQRIPVVFVHGLMSDAKTWSQMLNTLLHDPVLRRKYQFLGYAYSSGNPIFISGAKLRRELKQLREQLVQQKRSTENFDRMILVGHSMGGLLSKLQITSCGEAKVVRELDIRNPEALKSVFDESERKQLKELLNFEPLPFVRRVIFIAVPHRGSEIATGLIARIGSALIRLPADLVRRNVQLFKAFVGGGQIDSSAQSQFGTGIGNLRPDDSMLRLLDKLEISPRVPYHSVIGNCKAQGIPGGSDGVVPYSSSHLDGAVSELVVKSGHSVQQNELAIQEVRRILLLHVESGTEKNK